LEGGVFTSLSPAQSPWPLGGLPLPALPDCVDLGEGASLLASQGGEFWLHKGTWKGSRTNLGAPLIRLVRKNPGSNSGLLQEAKGESDQLLEGTPVTPFLEVKLCLSGSGSKVEVLCCVRVCESVSLRGSLVMKQVWSPDPRMCGKLM
jgi:hypothetical protein